MIAIIPARGGSKGVPYKNIRHLGGKPLIAYTIEAALKAESIHRVIVTTENERIAETARLYGAEVPFKRPDELAGDHAKAQEVYIHAAEYLRDYDGEDITKFMVLLATVPFRTAEHINDAVRVFHEKQPETLVSVKKMETPPSWLFIKDQKERIYNAGFDMKTGSGNRQENPVYYVPNGAIYILDFSLLKRKLTYYSSNTIGYLMEEDVSVDIDTMADFEYAQYLIDKKKGIL